MPAKAGQAFSLPTRYWAVQGGAARGRLRQGAGAVSPDCIRSPAFFLTQGLKELFASIDTDNSGGWGWLGKWVLVLEVEATSAPPR